MCCEFAMNFFLFIIILGAAICSLGFCTSISDIPCHDSERQALLSFKHGLTDPSNRLASWVESGNCCDWYGVICHNLTGHIRELHLRNPIPSVDYDLKAEAYYYDLEPEDNKQSKLGGKIETSLLALKHLHYLDLSNNDFGGIEIPKFFGSMQSLRYLNLSTAGFDGKIPYQLGNLTNLLYLDIRQEFRYDSYVENLEWLSDLSMLCYLNLNYVNLSKASDKLQGTIALPLLEELHLAWCGLSHIPLLPINSSYLTVLDLSGNQISSHSAATTRGFGLDSLVFLDLSSNDVGGPVSSCLRNLTSLKYLYLSQCGLNSTLPNWLYKFSQLEELVLSYNSLQDIKFEDFANLTYLTHLDLSGNEIGKKVSFGGLGSLVFLDLSYNDVDGPVPNCLRNLTSLKYLYLFICGLNSTLPNWLYKFSQLEELVLSHNSLRGIKFEDFANLTYFTHLDLSRNDIGQKVSFRNASDRLQHLLLSDCKLSDSLLFESGQFKNLKELDLSSNFISGPIPEYLGTLTSLKVLSLGDNQLNGTSQSLWHLHHLEDLDLWQNNISGQIPDSIGSLTFLVSLSLGSNQLSGPLPSSIGQLYRLKYLDLGNNKIYGMLPNFIGSLTSLVSLSLGSNQLSGPLPSSIGQLYRLKYLDLGNNKISGMLPNFIGSLTSLVSLDLKGNQLSGPLPSIIEQVYHLEYLYLGGNKISGLLPNSIGSLTSLETLDLSKNQLSGPLPDSLGKLFRLKYLYLQQNNISGLFPNSVGSLTYLVELSLFENQLWGPLPHLLSDIHLVDFSRNFFSGHISRLLCDGTNETKSLLVLRLGNNHLSGEIPDCWSSLPFVASIQLQNNKLIGDLPSSLGSLVDLQYLHLRNNNLSGVLPSLQNCTSLIILDVGENKLGGSIPKWIGQKLSTIRILRLRSNNFGGHITEEICALKFLAVLDLAHNNLTGIIPKCFSNLSAMANFSSLPMDWTSFVLIGKSYYRTSRWPTDGETVILVTKALELEYSKNLYLMTDIDLSDNSFSGQIPEAITNLKGLRSLNLSRNCLTGTICENVGNMPSLESLDLSLNQLSGKIPQSMAQMTSLAFLNLSWNNLTGRIPTSTQLQSFNASSFTGNNLCGLPISDNCNTTNGSTPSKQNKDMNYHGFDEFYVSMSLGFVVGFGVVVGPLFYSISWRITYFLWLQSMGDKLWVLTLLLIRARFGRRA